jgi:hypothetical protein
MTQEAVLSRVPVASVASLAGKGRLGIRSAEQTSDLAFELAYAESLGLRLDFTWKGFVGLVKRTGSLLVRGDSIWVRLPDDEQFEDPAWRDGTALRQLLLGLSPHEFVGLLIEGPEDLHRREDEIVAFQSLDDDRCRFELADAERREAMVLDGESGDLLAREIWPEGQARKIEIAYGKHAQAGVARRPFAIEFRDSCGPVDRGKIAFSEQKAGARFPISRFEPEPSARLMEWTGAGRNSAKSSNFGTLGGERGRPES